MIKVLGGTSVDGNITGVNKAELFVDNGRVLYEHDTDNNTVKHYSTDAVQRPEGVALLSGNYLNPLSLREPVLTSSTVVLTGNYSMPNPAVYTDGYQFNFVRAKGSVGAQVTSESPFKTDSGDVSVLEVGAAQGFTVTKFNGRWEV